jgi:uncharacterized protein (TIGR03084 family)
MAPAADLIEQLTGDLAAESGELGKVLRRLATADWDKETPAAGWNVRDQVTHLAFFDDATLLSITDRPAFEAQRGELLGAGDHFPDIVAARYRDRSGPEALDWFLRSRDALLAAYRAADPGLRLPWYGPDMGLASSLTARLMETWAHGQDVIDTIGGRRQPTARLRHVADLGVRTFAFSFLLHGLPPPADEVLVELTGPDAQRWTWGPGDAANRVEGEAQDFCLVVVQRRAVADTGLTVTGPVAAQWMSIAQAFAGRPSDPPRPGRIPVPPASDGSRG